MDGRINAFVRTNIRRINRTGRTPGIHKETAMLHSFAIGTPANKPSKFLSDDQLHRQAPSIFAEAAHGSRSDRYAYIPTSKVIEGLRAEGFAPVKVQVARVRDDGRAGFEKHMIRFRQVDTSIVKVGEVLPEVVLVNSHDGSTSYKLSAGLFRLVCSNGLVVPQGELEEVRIKHTGGSRIVHDVIEGSFRVLEQSNLAIEAASRWSQLQLTSGEQTALAVGAHHLRFADAAGNVETPIEPTQLLRTRRNDDRRDDLWTVFNRIQENAIKGGLSGVGRDAEGHRRRVTTREVKGIDGNLNLNKGLWKMAEHLAALKASN